MSTEKNEQIEKVDFITTELQKFNVANATIAEWSDKFMPLKIDGIKDTKGYAEVREARLFMKGRRVEVQKTSKLLKEDALKFQRAVNEEEKRIIALMDPIETHLEKEEDAYDAEKKHIKEEKERQEQLRFNQRNVALLNNGCSFNGDMYAIGEHSILQTDIRFISDETFDEFLEKVKLEHQKELDEKAEQERLQREEAERLKVEREAIDKERAELQRQRDEVEAQRQQQEQERRAHEHKILEAERQKEREIELKKAQEQAAKQAKADLLEKQRLEKERTIEQERKAKARAERLEKLKPVKQKLSEFATLVNNIEIPDLKDAEADEILTNAKGLLNKVVDYINMKSENL